MVKLLDAFGKDTILIETVGAGQAEVDIVKLAHTVIIVTMPGGGDDIQSIKAGIMEIGDIFVVNKADRENADKAVVDIKSMLELSDEKAGRDPVIVKTVAITGQGTTELLEEIDKHQKYLKKAGSSPRQQEILEKELIEAIKDKTAKHIIKRL